ncbi:unnamed protein product [Choristocarpus tenellus]
MYIAVHAFVVVLLCLGIECEVGEGFHGQPYGESGTALPAAVLAVSSGRTVDRSEFGCLYRHAGNFDVTHKTGRGWEESGSFTKYRDGEVPCEMNARYLSSEAIVRSKVSQHPLEQLGSGMKAVASWGSSRSEEVVQVVRGTRVGLSKWTGQGALVARSVLSGLSMEVGRCTENAFSTLKIRRFGGKCMEAGVGQYKGMDLEKVTNKALQNVVDVVRKDGWEHVATTNGVVVHRKYISFGEASGTPLTSSSGTDGSCSDGQRSSVSSSPQFACVRATAVLDVPADIVYRLFADNSYVGEYNEHCKEVADLETLDADTKITWAASGRMGPFKARDFCTMVHFRTLSDGTMAQVSCPVEHARAPRTSKYVRSEVLLAGNFMRPVPGDPTKTEFLMVTHVNPGGAAETRAGALLVNSLCASSPVNFICRLEAAAQRLLRELEDSGQRGGVSPFNGLQRDRLGTPVAPGLI